MKYVLWILIIGLIISAGVMGYQVFHQEKKLDQVQPKITQVREDVAIVQDYPAAGSSQEQQIDYIGKVKALAREADFLELADCKANPTVLHIRNKSTLLIKNTGKTDQTFAINQDMAYLIEAGQEKEVYLDMPNGEGVYGYGCGPEPKPQGALWVTND